MNVNFSVFIDKILSGEKRQTIRKAGKKWENVKAGDKLTLYTGLRTKKCRKLGEAEVESIEDIVIRIGFLWSFVCVGEIEVSEDEALEIAKADGFDCIRDFFEFFNNHYGLHFTGKIIKWKNFRKAE